MNGGGCNRYGPQVNRNCRNGVNACLIPGRSPDWPVRRSSLPGGRNGSPPTSRCRLAQPRRPDPRGIFPKRGLADAFPSAIHRAQRSTDAQRGEVAEWSIAPHSKCGVRVTVPGVRIPPSPPFALENPLSVSAEAQNSSLFSKDKLRRLFIAASARDGKSLLCGAFLSRPVDCGVSVNRLVTR